MPDPLEQETRRIVADLESKGVNTSNPAALVAALGGDLANAVVASTPGGIERQEKEGQTSFVANERLPTRCLDRDFSCTDYLESLGFEFGEVGEGRDHIFIDCKFPAGWKKEASDHSMWSHLVDPQGRRRASIFFKAAFYDYNAHIGFQPRYSVAQVYCDVNGQSVEYDEQTHLQMGLYDGVKEIARLGDLIESPYGNTQRRGLTEEAIRQARQLADEVSQAARAALLEQYPKAKDPRAYWDEP